MIRWGNAVHDNPTADRPDVTCRRFSADTLDVIVGARPRFRSDWEQGTDPADSTRRGVAMNADVDLMADRVSYRVTVETPGRRPLSAVLFDVERQSVMEVEVFADDRTATFEVDCNWFMAVLGYGESAPVAVIDLPARRAAGRCRGRHRLAARGRGAAELHRHALGTVTGVARAAPGNGPRHVRAGDSGDGRFRLPPDSTHLQGLSRV